MIVWSLLQDELILPELQSVVCSIQPFVELNEDVLEEFSPILFHSKDKQSNYKIVYFIEKFNVRLKEMERNLMYRKCHFEVY